MPSTQLEIYAQDFVLCCPHCEAPLHQEIRVGKLYQLEVECEDCFETCFVRVTLSKDGDDNQ